MDARLTIHYGETADGWAQYADDVDALSREIVRYAVLPDVRDAEQAVRIAELNLARREQLGWPAPGFTVQVGELFVERETAAEVS